MSSVECNSFRSEQAWLRKWKMIASTVAVIIVLPLWICGCSTRLTSLSDLQKVFGPTGIRFVERELTLDLNGDGKPERLVLFIRDIRGLELPPDVSAFMKASLLMDLPCSMVDARWFKCFISTVSMTDISFSSIQSKANSYS
jgi:hypothetical protein